MNVRNDADHGLSCGHTRGPRIRTRIRRKGETRRGAESPVQGERERGDFEEEHGSYTRLTHAESPSPATGDTRCHFWAVAFRETDRTLSLLRLNRTGC